MDINNHFQIKILELERFQTLQYLKRLIVRPKNPTILLFTQYKKVLYDKSYTINLNDVKGPAFHKGSHLLCPMLKKIICAEI